MSNYFEGAICPREEMNCFETLFADANTTRKRLSELFDERPGLPSQLLKSLMVQNFSLKAVYDEVSQQLGKLTGFSVAVTESFIYPQRLLDAAYPARLFYYRGNITLTETPSVSVVGARAASQNGIDRAKRIARELTKAGVTIVSGLAEGIDTAAMTEAIRHDGKVIGVIGTPINESYPKSNVKLQEKVAKEHLLISHVPFYRYSRLPFVHRKNYFPERNEVMAALSQATIIVEASETSGTLTQARAAINQKRKLFILSSCFENPSISWPQRYEKLGAIRVRNMNDILDNITIGECDGSSFEVDEVGCQHD